MCGIFFVLDAGSSGSEIKLKFNYIASNNLNFVGPMAFLLPLDHSRKIDFGGFDIHGS